ncbi:ABC transporter permease [Levilactobacillus zymae]|uniref:ABC transporter permease n=1 Tax=Levilactobacillus zymae TaxID=267363 RepID=A0ABQ0WZU2_9LACO|nr:ABC transporter permease [Levilactobacillus zymae]QFR61597.1 ABC transporter permease subunit [Levilactobacillus zymae]GEO73130.1 ABC transporter permease [Levilactobacillus zymae]
MRIIKQTAIVISIEMHKIFRAGFIPISAAAFLFLLLVKHGQNWADFTNSGLMFIVALIGLVGFGALSSWVFAQEFTAQTFKDLLALPISRKTIIAGKMLAIELSELAITVLEVLLLLGTGWLWLRTPIPAGQWQLITLVVPRTFVYNVLLSLVWPFIASLTRSVLIPTALSFATMIVAVMFAGQTVGQYIPWVIPSYNLANPGFSSSIGYLLIVLIGLIGIYGTIYVWTVKDQQ